jgi:CHAT domain-containing protein/tetratricopeptide (TPR) repeat protein
MHSAEPHWILKASLGLVLLPLLGSKPAHAQALNQPESRQHTQLAERDRLANQVKELRQSGKLVEALDVAERRLELERKAGEDNPARLAEALSRLAELHELRREWERALERRREVLAIRRKSLPNDHPDIAESQHNVGLAQWYLGENSEAKSSYQEALAIRRKVLPKDHPDSAQTLHNLGLVLDALGELKLAKESYQEALAIRRKALPKNAPDTAWSLNNLGDIQYKLREYAAAKASYEEALAIRRKALSPDHTDIAQSLRNVGWVQRDLNELAAARQNFEEEAAIRRKAPPTGQSDLALSLFNLAELEYRLADFPAAKASYEEALAIRRKILTPNDPGIAEALNNLAVAQRALRQYAAAKASYAEALTIMRKVVPPRHADIAAALNNLGNLQWELQEYSAAKQSALEALAIRRNALPKEGPDVAQSLINLGVIQGSLRDYAGAKKSNEDALAIFRKALPPDHPDLASNLCNLGFFQIALEEYAAAKKNLEEALAIRRKVLPANHPDIAAGLTNLGLCQQRLGDLAGAKASFEEALASLRKALPPDHPTISASLCILGAAQFQLEEFAAAKQGLQEAMAISRDTLPRDHPQIASYLLILGASDLAQGVDVGSAVHRLAEAQDILQFDQLRMAVVQAEPEQLASTAMAKLCLDLLIDASLATKGNVELAYDRVLRLKGAVTAHQRWARQARDAADPETARLLSRLREVTGQIVDLSVSMGLLNPSSAPPNAPAALRALSDERTRVEQQLTERSGAYRAIRARAYVGVKEVREALPEGTALVDFVDHLYMAVPGKGEQGASQERRLVAFVVRPGAQEVAIVPLGLTQVAAELIDGWRASYGVGKPPPDGARDPAAELRKRLWEPLASHLKGTKLVVVSPDGPLNFIPWSALPGSTSGTFLIQEYVFALVPVPQLLPELLRGRKGGQAGPASLVMGDIDFDAHSGTDARAARENRYPPLPGTRAEADAVQNAFRAAFAGTRAELITGAEASKSAFVSRAPGCSHLLVATHGFSLSEREQRNEPRGRAPARPLEASLFPPEPVLANPTLRSGLVFAGANYQAAGHGSAFLTAQEVGELDLGRVDLAVFSACETGLGQVRDGEGMLGLQRALHVAGARTAVTSLWKVPDAATQALMSRFHRNLWEKKMPKLEALREAQLWLIQEGWKHPELGLRGGLERPMPKPNADQRVSPFYWAAFVLSGDWR